MDKNTMVTILGTVATTGLVIYGTIMGYLGVDSAITTAVAASLGAIIGAAAVYIKTH